MKKTFITLLVSLMLTVGIYGQCPSGINLSVSSGSQMIKVWSPLSNGDYYISRGQNYGTHVNLDQYALDFNMDSTSDYQKAVFLPITGRVFKAYRAGTSTNPNYGNTVLIWDPGTGILVRLAHLDSFSTVVNNTSAGGWLGAGTKAGYIGESGCPGCGTHLHVAIYRNVKVGVWDGTRNVTEADIINKYLSQGLTPPYAQSQNFRIVAPSDNCELVKFSDNPTVYTKKSSTLYPVTGDAWKSWGLSVNLVPRQGQYDSTAGAIPVKVLPTYERSFYIVSGQFANPRNEAVFRGYTYPDVYVFRNGVKQILTAGQFSDNSPTEFRWKEIQPMDQNYVDRIPPITRR